MKFKKKYVLVNWRLFFIYCFIFFMLFILMLRIIYLQIITPDVLNYQSDIRSVRMKDIPAIREMILDRAGRALAISVPVYAVWADPKELSKYFILIDNERWRALADVLSISYEEFISRITRNTKVRFVYLARQVRPVIKDYIYQLNLPGIYLREESKRYYPYGCITSHIIGITNIDGKGIEGVEKSFDNLLSGYPGRRRVRMDRNGKVVEDISIVNKKLAKKIVLSIDEKLQSVVYRELNKAVMLHKAESGSAILIDVNTGEVLAMANSPSYNPNNLSNIIISSMRNRSITDLFEPGSTIKPVVIITALHHGCIQENSIINTSPYVINGYLIKDVTYHNELTVSEILQQSSNVGVSKIALSMPSSVLEEGYLQFGIGRSTDIGLVGESNGLYPHKKKLSDIERVTFSYGYGFMVTPLQLAKVYSILGSMGVCRPLSIIKVDYPVAGKQVFPSLLVRKVINMMESISLPSGIGSQAAIKGYRVAVKTGTAKKVGKYGKYINRYVAYTAGVAPASHPQFALVVIINDPCTGKYYGGAVSAPVFSIIMENILRIMNIEPDSLF